jgi:hypothetical protein
MELTTTRELIRRSNSKVPRYLQNSHIHYCIQKSHPFPTILSHTNPVQITQFHLRSILILSTHLRFRLSSSLFPSGFPTNKLYRFLFYTIRDTGPSHLRRLCLKILLRIGEEEKSCSSSLSSFFHPSSLHPLWSNYSPQLPALKHLQSMFLL